MSGGASSSWCGPTGVGTFTPGSLGRLPMGGTRELPWFSSMAARLLTQAVVSATPAGHDSAETFTFFTAVAQPFCL